MKKWLKVTLIILLILFLIIASLGIYAYTKYQKIKPLLDLVKEQDQIGKDLNEIMAGNCTKLPALESKAIQVEKDLTNACNDKVIVYFIKKYAPQDPCQILPNYPQVKANLQKIKEICAIKGQI